MEKIALCLADYGEYFTGLVFPELNKSVTELPPIMTYKIRHNSKLVDSTGSIADSHNSFSRDNPLVDLKYLTFGFAFLQEALESKIVERQTNTTLRTGLYAQQEPYAQTMFDSFNVTIFLSLFVMLSWMTPASLLVKNIVYEKEMRLKEMMRKS
jgi:ATP-binding cassette subfamily A (ABC1) protein 1